MGFLGYYNWGSEPTEPTTDETTDQDRAALRKAPDGGGGVAAASADPDSRLGQPDPAQLYRLMTGLQHHPHMARYLAAVLDRLDKGSAEYGQTSFERPPTATVAELLDEVADVSGWASILYQQLADLAEAVRDVDEAPDAPRDTMEVTDGDEAATGPVTIAPEETTPEGVADIYDAMDAEFEAEQAADDVDPGSAEPSRTVRVYADMGPADGAAERAARAERSAAAEAYRQIHATPSSDAATREREDERELAELLRTVSKRVQTVGYRRRRDGHEIEESLLLGIDAEMFRAAMMLDACNPDIVEQAKLLIETVRGTVLHSVIALTDRGYIPAPMDGIFQLVLGALRLMYEFRAVWIRGEEMPSICPDRTEFELLRSWLQDFSGRLTISENYPDAVAAIALLLDEIEPILEDWPFGGEDDDDSDTETTPETDEA